MNGILLTGGNGFVGSHVINAAVSSGSWCVSLDLPSAAVAARRPCDQCSTIECDVTSASSIESAFQAVLGRFGHPSRVYHLAAQASVTRSIKDPGQTYRTNVVGTATLLDVLSRLAPDVPVLIPSSAHVYGAPRRADGILSEESTLAPDSHYGASKMAQEMVGRLFHQLRGQPVYLARAFNHVGPGQGPGFVFSDFARRLAELELVGGGTMSVGNLDLRRDFLDVRDVTSAYATILECGEAGVVYNVASGRTWLIREILELFLSQLSVDIDLRTDPALLRASDVPIMSGDASRLGRLGWQPRYRLEDTARDTLNYWRERLAWRSGEETA